MNAFAQNCSNEFHYKSPEDIITSLPTEPTRTRRSSRTTIPPSRYGSIDIRDLAPSFQQQLYRQALALNALVDHQLVKPFSPIRCPTTFTDAMYDPKYAEQWYEATKNEIESIIKLGTFIQVDPSKVTKKPLSTRMVYVVKYTPLNEIEKFKGRLVIRGFSQQPNIDYDVNDIASPVCKITSLFTTLNIATQLSMKVKVVDFTTAFLNSHVDNDLFIKLPYDIAKEFYNIRDEKQNIFKLIKALYGLKQSPQLWFKTISSFLISLGYKQLSTDSCVFIKTTDTYPIIIDLYVDDTTICYDPKHEHIWKQDLEKIKSKFNLKEVDLKKLLGIHITQTKDSLILSQQHYIESLIKQFEITVTKNIQNPIATDTSNLTNDSIYTTSTLLNDKQLALYRSIIGALSFLASRTRPDISYITNILSRFGTKAYTVHMNAAIRVLQYIYSTKHYTLVFNKSKTNQFIITAYADASHSTNIDNKSTLAYVIMINNNPISWASIKAKVPALSSAESELYAITSAAQEILFIQSLFKEILSINIIPTLLVDNKAAIEIASSINHYKRSKHISTKYHFIKHLILYNILKLKWIKSEEQLADPLTKKINNAPFFQLISQLLNTNK